MFKFEIYVTNSMINELNHRNVKIVQNTLFIESCLYTRIYDRLLPEAEWNWMYSVANGVDWSGGEKWQVGCVTEQLV
jgi:hypothetical protein